MSIQAKEALIFGRQILSDGEVVRIEESDLQSIDSSKGLVWLHLDYEAEIARKWMRDHSGIEESLVEYLLADDSRPGVFLQGDQLMLVLRAINLNEKQDPEDLVAIRSYLSSNLIVTLRRRRVHFVQKMRESLDKGEGFRNAAEFLPQLLEHLVKEIGHQCGIIDDRISQLEGLDHRINQPELIDQLLGIQRDLNQLSRFLHPQKLTLQHLLRLKVGWFDEDISPVLHNQSELHFRYSDDLDYHLKRTQVIKEEIASERSEMMNRRLYLLALVSMVFLPLTLLTGLLGVNLAGIPYAEHPFAFWGLCVGMGFLFAVILVLLRKTRWF
jgi:zinc transporter